MTEISIGGLKIKITLDDSELIKGETRAKTVLSNIDQHAAKVGRRIGQSLAVGFTAGVGAFTAALGFALARINETEKLTRQLDRALSNTGNTARTSAAEVQSFAEKLEESTGRAAEEILAVSTNLATFGFGRDQFFRAIELADDMAAAWGGDLKQNVEGLARALADPEKGLAMLEKRGITFTRQQTEMIESFKKANDVVGAQGVVFEALEEQVKGVAQEGYTGLRATLGRTQEALESVFEEVSMDLIPSLEDLGETFRDPATLQGIKTFAQLIVTGLNAVIQGATWALNSLTSLQDFFKDTQAKSDTGLSERLSAIPNEIRAIEDQMAAARKRLDTGDTLFGINISNLESQITTGTERLAELRRESIETFKEIDRRALSNLPVAGLADPSIDWGNEGEGEGSGEFGRPDTSGAALQEKLDNRLLAIQESLRTEQESAAFAHEEMLTELQLFLDNGMITQAEYNALKEEAEAQHWENMKDIAKRAQDDITDFTKMSYLNQAKTIFGELESITSAVKDHNDALFFINKGAAVANAVINAYEGISKSLATYPMPLAAVMAGVHAAAGFAQVSAILATTRNTKSASPVGLSSGGAGEQSGPSTPGGTDTGINHTLFLKGIDPSSLYSGANVRDLVEKLVEFQKDGGKLVLGGT